MPQRLLAGASSGRAESDGVRIALVHSFYSARQPSGENDVVERQLQLLEKAGHYVRLFARATDGDDQSVLFKSRAGFRVATGIGGDPSSELREFNPDVVHVHNLFPNFGTQWIRRWQGPVVVSLHNYRAVCSRGDLYRDGAHCEDCATFGNHRALVHGCYRDSRLATLPLAISRSNFQRDVLMAADAVVTTSSTSDAEMKRLIDVPLTTRLIPNPGPDEGVKPVRGAFRSGWIAMGRLSPEKGFIELIESWPAEESLDLVGSGPIADQITTAIRGTGITFKKSMTLDELRDGLRGYLGLVFPSRWIEVAPQVVVEAMRVGLPVIAYEGNGVSSLVSESKTGLTYHDAGSLVRAIDTISADVDEFSSRAFNYYRERWDPRQWLTSTMELYRDITGDKGAT